MLPVLRTGVTMFVTTRICAIRRWWRPASNYSLQSRPSQEGEPDHAAWVRRAADVNVEGRPFGGVALVHRRERNPHAKAGRHRPARHVARIDPMGKNAVAGPRDSSIVHPHADEPRIIVARALRLERLETDEGPGPFHDPNAIHLERRLVPVEVLPGQKIAFFQAKRVPRPEADRLDAEVRPGFQERFPDPRSLGRCRKQLESRLSCVPRSCDEKRGSSTGNGGVPGGRGGDAWGTRLPPPLHFRWNRARAGAPRRRRHEVDRHAGGGRDSTQIDGRETLEEPGRPRTRERQAEPRRP